MQILVPRGTSAPTTIKRTLEARVASEYYKLLNN